MGRGGREGEVVESLEDPERVLALSRLVDRWADEHLAGEPKWGPLLGALPAEWCGGFMWMQRVDDSGVIIELYKHGITRRHLNLDGDGRAYRYTGSGYMEITLAEAVEWVFDGIEAMGWSRETVYDDEFRATKYRALAEAGWTMITTRPQPLVGLEHQNEHGDRNDAKQGD